MEEPSAHAKPKQQPVAPLSSTQSSSLPKDAQLGSTENETTLRSIFKDQVILLVEKGIGAIQCKILKQHIIQKGN